MGWTHFIICLATAVLLLLLFGADEMFFAAVGVAALNLLSWRLLLWLSPDPPLSARISWLSMTYDGGSLLVWLNMLTTLLSAGVFMMVAYLSILYW